MGGEHKIFIQISHFFCMVGTWNSNFASLQFLPFTFRIGCIYHMGNSWNCSVCFFVAQSAAKRKSIEQVRWDLGDYHGTAFLRSVGSFALLSMRNKRSPDCRQVISGRKFECDLLFSYIAGDPFFTPIFALSALILGALREKLSGVLKNLLLLAVGPVGFIIFTGTALRQLGKIHSGQGDSIFSIFAAAVCWVIFMFVPYGFMLWHGKKEQDKMKIHNGTAGIWAVNFFMLGLFLLGYICRGR